ncbi:MAG: SRPBCC family protein [Hyphomicrobiaceae bacterium]
MVRSDDRHGIGAGVIALVAIVFMVQSGFAAPKSTLTGTQLSRLAKGDVLIDVVAAGGTSGRIWAAIEIAASPHQLWKLMLDCRRTRRIIQGLESCRILDQGTNRKWDVREHKVRWLWFLPITRTVFRSDYVPHRKIRFRRAGGDLRSLEGEWTLQALRGGQKTRLTYRARVDPGLPLPGVLVRTAISRDVATTLRALRREATRRSSLR